MGVVRFTDGEPSVMMPSSGIFKSRVGVTLWKDIKEATQKQTEMYSVWKTTTVVTYKVTCKVTAVNPYEQRQLVLIK